MTTAIATAPSPRRLVPVPPRKASDPRPICTYCTLRFIAAQARVLYPEHPDRPTEYVCRDHAREMLATADPIEQARDRLRLACQAERKAKDETDAAGHALDELLRADRELAAARELQAKPAQQTAERPVPQVCRFPVPEPEEPPRGKRV